MKVYGPYVSRSRPDQPRRFVVLQFEDGTRKTTSYARYLMAQHLDRELTEDEEVDHIDDDRMNDVITNLQVLTPQANRDKRPKEVVVTIICPICLEPAEKRAWVVRQNRKRGHAGPFCGRVCARQYQLQQQGSVAEQADAPVSETGPRKGMRVRLPPGLPVGARRGPA